MFPGIYSKPTFCPVFPLAPSMTIKSWLHARVHFRTFSFFLLSFWCWGPEGSRSKGQSLLKSQLKLSLCEGHLLPELSGFSAHQSIFAVELAAPCQGSLPQIELLEGPAGFLQAFRHLFTFHLASLPLPQKGIFGAPSVLLTAGTLGALQGDAFGAAGSLA